MEKETAEKKENYYVEEKKGKNSSLPLTNPIKSKRQMALFRLYKNLSFEVKLCYHDARVKSSKTEAIQSIS